MTLPDFIEELRKKLPMFMTARQACELKNCSLATIYADLRVNPAYAIGSG
jgi:hypothetical protein